MKKGKDKQDWESELDLMIGSFDVWGIEAELLKKESKAFISKLLKKERELWENENRTREIKAISNNQKGIWNCRFHPTDWWHEVGCPHIQHSEQSLLAYCDNPILESWKRKEIKRQLKEKLINV